MAEKSVQLPIYFNPQHTTMYKLVLMRHGESTWNLENRFTGWTDVDLTPLGLEQAVQSGRLLKAEGYDFDLCYTSVLKRATRGMQGDPHLTEALTRAFMFADKSVAAEIHVVGMQLTRMLTKAMKGTEYVEGAEPTEEEIAIARVISDVWLSALVSWVTGRSSADEVAEHIETAVRLLLR